MTDETKALVICTKSWAWQKHDGEWSGVSIDGRHALYRCREAHLIELLAALEAAEADVARLREGLRQVRTAAIEGDARASRESGGDSCGATALYGIRMIADHVLNEEPHD